jgi:hypothetical protein
MLSLIKSFFAPTLRSHRRVLLRDLHTFGIVSIFRRPSLLRVWEPLRENHDGHANFSG